MGFHQFKFENSTSADQFQHLMLRREQDRSFFSLFQLCGLDARGFKGEMRSFSCDHLSCAHLTATEP